MKKLHLLFLLVFPILLFIAFSLSSCQRETTEYHYRVQFVTSKAKTIVTDIEKGTETYGSYRIGDTVHITKENTISTDGRYRKAVVINILN